jgi:hypothetical protein
MEIEHSDMPNRAADCGEAAVEKNGIIEIYIAQVRLIVHGWRIFAGQKSTEINSKRKSCFGGVFPLNLSPFGGRFHVQTHVSRDCSDAFRCLRPRSQSQCGAGYAAGGGV